MMFLLVNAHVGRAAADQLPGDGGAALPTAVEHLLEAGAAVGVDALAGFVDRLRDRAAQEDRSKSDRRADDGEDQRILGRRSARVILQHVDESFHFIFLPSVVRASAEQAFAAEESGV